MEKLTPDVDNKAAPESSGMTPDVENAYYGWLYSKDRVVTCAEQYRAAKVEMAKAADRLQRMDEQLQHALDFRNEMRMRYEQIKS